MPIAGNRKHRWLELLTAFVLWVRLGFNKTDEWDNRFLASLSHFFIMRAAHGGRRGGQRCFDEPRDDG